MSLKNFLKLLSNNIITNIRLKVGAGDINLEYTGKGYKPDKTINSFMHYNVRGLEVGLDENNNPVLDLYLLI